MILFTYIVQVQKTISTYDTTKARIRDVDINSKPLAKTHDDKQL